MIQPKLTEEFLLAQEGVIDASVWHEQDGLRAHVTQLETAGNSERSLQSACLTELGAHQTPRAIMMLSARCAPGFAVVRTTERHPSGLAA
jgi:hypothetical protein